VEKWAWLSGWRVDAGFDLWVRVLFESLDGEFTRMKGGEGFWLLEEVDAVLGKI
jgi:hypothetical protein